MRLICFPRPRIAFALIAATGVCLSGARDSFAVILYRSATRNTSAPTGALANSGWQFQGEFNGYNVTPIASQYFITAQHIGGSIGETISYNNVNYSIDSSFNNNAGFTDLAGTDLRIWKIAGSFSTFAPLYNPAVDGSEVGKFMTVFGRGTQRGSPVYAETPSPPRDGGADSNTRELKGWSWGTDDRVESWGTNLVTAIADGGDTLGKFLQFNFDRNGTADEGGISSGDSSGGVFIQGANGSWELAGVNYGLDGPWQEDLLHGSFNADLFDAGGLYLSGNSTTPPQLVPDTSDDAPAASYASSISANLSWIDGVIGVTPAFINPAAAPEPASALGLILLGALMRRRRN